MGRKVLKLSLRTKNTHHELTRHLIKAKVSNADLARVMGCSEQLILNYLMDPHRLDIRQCTIIAGMLSVSPEYVMYIIRFNSINQGDINKLEESFATYKTRFAP